MCFFDIHQCSLRKQGQDWEKLGSLDVGYAKVAFRSCAIVFSVRCFRRQSPWRLVPYWWSAQHREREDAGRRGRRTEEAGAIPLPTLIPPRKTGIMLFLVSVDLAFDVRAIMTSKTSNRERVYLGVIQGGNHQDAKHPGQTTSDQR
jgi:hypothetical protein